MPETIKIDEAIEILDITDDHDNVVGQQPRSEIKIGEFCNIRMVNGFLINGKGELWIPRRTTRKKLFPSCLDMGIGGYVKSDEDYDGAFRREIKEELNIDPDTIQYVKLGKLSPYESRISSFTTVYAVYTNMTPQFDTNNFSEASWITPEDLVKKLKNGEPAKSDLSLLVEKFLLPAKKA